MRRPDYHAVRHDRLVMLHWLTFTKGTQMHNPKELFGEKVCGMIENAQIVADNLKFRSKVDQTVDDLISVVEIAMQSILHATENKDGDDHFGQPELPEEQSSMSVDDLIAESYVYGKSDEEISGEFKKDLHATIKDFSWLLVSIGIALDNEDKIEITKMLKQKTIELFEKERKLNELEKSTTRQ